jgi:hypothetical protein
MSEILISQIIREARSLIADPDNWIEGEFAQTAAGESCDPWDPDAAAFCAFGALVKAAYGMSNDSGLAMHFAQSAASAILGDQESRPEELFLVNDDEGREAMLALFEARLKGDAKRHAPHPDRSLSLLLSPKGFEQR